VSAKRGFLLSALLGFASRLRFPVLFAITAVLFAVNMVVPDALPMIDELMLGLATVLLASWRKRRAGGEEEPPSQRSAA